MLWVFYPIHYVVMLWVLLTESGGRPTCYTLFSSLYECIHYVIMLYILHYNIYITLHYITLHYLYYIIVITLVSE